jgi:hypothetical protein
MPVTLLYHDLVAAGADDDSGFAGPGAARYKLGFDEFAEHLTVLGRQVTHGPEAHHPAAAATPWMLTFDDGGVSAMAIADQLEARGWRGWFFMTTDRIGTKAFLSARQLVELHSRGHRIGSHSCSHPARMSYCSPDELRSEWRFSKARLEELLAAPVQSASVPGGFYSRAVATAADEAGITLLFNSEPTTSTGRVGNCQVLGRYTVYRGMSASSAGQLLRSPVSRWKQTLAWTAKKCAKRLGGTVYLHVRERIFRRAYAHPATSG